MTFDEWWREKTGVSPSLNPSKTQRDSEVAWKAGQAEALREAARKVVAQKPKLTNSDERVGLEVAILVLSVLADELENPK